MEGNEAADSAGAGRRGACEFIGPTSGRFGYRRLAGGGKGLVRRCLAKVTGRSRAQLTRLVRRYLDTERIAGRRGGPPARPFPRRGAKGDIRLPAQVDERLGRMSGPATRAVMRREFEAFADTRLEASRRGGTGDRLLYNPRVRRRSRAWACARRPLEFRSPASIHAGGKGGSAWKGGCR